MRNMKFQVLYFDLHSISSLLWLYLRRMSSSELYQATDDDDNDCQQEISDLVFSKATLFAYLYIMLPVFFKKKHCQS